MFESYSIEFESFFEYIDEASKQLNERFDQTKVEKAKNIVSPIYDVFLNDKSKFLEQLEVYNNELKNIRLCKYEFERSFFHKILSVFKNIYNNTIIERIKLIIGAIINPNKSKNIENLST